MSRDKSVNDVEEFVFFEGGWNISFIVTSSTAVWTDQTSETIPTCPDSWDSFLWKMDRSVCCFPIHTSHNKGDALRTSLWNFTSDDDKRKLNKDRPSDVTCFIISLFTAQHVSNVSTSIFRSCDLFWIYFIYCIALVRCVLVLRCGSAGVVWYPYAGRSTKVTVMLIFIIHAGINKTSWNVRYLRLSHLCCWRFKSLAHIVPTGN